MLVKLEYIDADADVAMQLLRAAQEGASHDLKQLLGLPIWPDYSHENGARLGIESVGTTPLILASREGHLEAV
eukprot:9134287-Heterocapsa_arctica.AAC.1